jgi:hypothetical protein
MVHRKPSDDPQIVNAPHPNDFDRWLAEQNQKKAGR